MKILGIDPGFDRVGWGVVTKTTTGFTLDDCGIIQTDKNKPFARRLLDIETELTTIIRTHHIDATVIESLFFATNAKTAINVAQARGVIILTCARMCARVVEKTPLQVKLAVTGDGHADKRAVEKMMRLQLRGIPEKLLDDTLDALACALTFEDHLYAA